MYGESQSPVIVPVVAGASTATLLPQTGADSVTTIAATVAAGLITWAAVYYVREIRGVKA